jgi:hypothetical protein
LWDQGVNYSPGIDSVFGGVIRSQVIRNTSTEEPVPMVLLVIVTLKLESEATPLASVDCNVKVKTRESIENRGASGGCHPRLEGLLDFFLD